MSVNYSKQSFVIDDDLCLALEDKRITCDMELELKRRNIQIIKTIKYHPDIKFIKKFINLKNKEILSLSKERLLDLGSIIPLMTRKE